MVSDASGIAYEFLFLNRPVIFYDVPALFECYGRNRVDYWGRECGEIVHDEKGMVEAVKRALSHPDYKVLDRQKMLKRIAYAPGKATEAAGLALLGLLSEKKSRR